MTETQIKEISDISEVERFCRSYLPFFNDKNYILTKTCEELTELQEVLLKTLNKKQEYQPSRQHMIEEIGDVEFRLSVLKETFGIDEKEINDRKISKANQIIVNINSGKYSKNI